MRAEREETRSLHGRRSLKTYGARVGPWGVVRRTHVQDGQRTNVEKEVTLMTTVCVCVLHINRLW